MIGVAAAVFLLARRLVRWQLALIMACVFVTYIFWATPQLSYNTMGAAFLTLGAALGLWVVLEGRGHIWALASGAAYGLGPYHCGISSMKAGHETVYIRRLGRNVLVL